ncbi:hypothetical protein EPI10_022348 [Gossypium australe]|uniref:Uncharacterized protein n=1 Tax=Gossypium australe TaxID=47621 RepID=A0A5B6WLV6_9ROSI|nr:hypothetical protein EPI10_022348 [Gossypium australe]
MVLLRVSDAGGGVIGSGRGMRKVGGWGCCCCCRAEGIYAFAFHLIGLLMREYTMEVQLASSPECSPRCSEGNTDCRR